MPAEVGRLRHRLRGRDRWFLGLIAAGVVAITLVGVGVVGRSETKPGPSCVAVTRPGFTGAATYHACGSLAPALCREYASEDAAFAADCRRKGFLSGR